jgi:hypothetical protein
MTFDPRPLQRSFDFDRKHVAELRRRWSARMEALVRQDIHSGRLASMLRLRKRFPDEHLRSVVGYRGWIPLPQGRIKGAMGACLNLRDAFNQVERGAGSLDGGTDFPAFDQDLLAFRQHLLLFLEYHEALRGDLPESRYDDAPDEDEDDH